MDPIRVGRSLRALRQRLRWRQLDLARQAGVSQQTVSDIERGRAAAVSLPRLGRVAAALDADLDLVVRWRGGALDRLLDERHAALCAAAAARLSTLGCEVIVEGSYSYFGERGSVDVLGWDSRRAALIVVEVKTELTSIEATLRKHDEKIRLGPLIARDRFGQSARIVIGLLVVSDDSTSRRRVERHAALLGATYPLRGRAAWAIAASGRGSARGLVFLSPTTRGGVRGGPVTRVRRHGPLPGG
jgi:transcriptional regulator with XRE-family HTH domain